MVQYLEERIVYSERFQARTLDFRGQLTFLRFDECEFVKCTILIDEQTENLAFTHCSFEDCNISELSPSPDRALLAEGNLFKVPIDIRKADLDRRLSAALASKS